LSKIKIEVGKTETQSVIEEIQAAVKMPQN
jgi:hypothetical protein